MSIWKAREPNWSGSLHRSHAKLCETCQIYEKALQAIATPGYRRDFERMAQEALQKARKINEA